VDFLLPAADRPVIGRFQTPSLDRDLLGLRGSDPRRQRPQTKSGRPATVTTHAARLAVAVELAEEDGSASARGPQLPIRSTESFFRWNPPAPGFEVGSPIAVLRIVLPQPPWDSAWLRIEITCPHCTLSSSCLPGHQARPAPPRRRLWGGVGGGFSRLWSIVDVHADHRTSTLRRTTAGHGLGDVSPSLCWFRWLAKCSQTHAWRQQGRDSLRSDDRHSVHYRPLPCRSAIVSRARLAWGVAGCWSPASFARRRKLPRTRTSYEARARVLWVEARARR